MVLCVCPEHDLDTHSSKGWREEPVTQLVVGTADDDVTSLFPLQHRLGSNVYIATAPVESCCATAARSADRCRRITSFAGLEKRFLLFPPLCVLSKSAV